jgi:hypothetical protein
MGWTAGIRFPAKTRDLASFYSVQTCSGVHRASYPVGIGVPSKDVKRPEREVDHSPQSNVKVKNVGFVLWFRTEMTRDEEQGGPGVKSGDKGG